jgi:predicted hotdog family 3-hydroxylacyl-ACP dehydratase
MVLLDRIVAYSDDSVTCEVQIHPGSRFFAPARGPAVDSGGVPAVGSGGVPAVDSGGVPAVVGLEYMAQCIAVFAGMGARAGGVEKRIGLLLGCRELNLHTDVFRAGQTLSVSVHRTWGESDLGSFTCRIEHAGETLVAGTLTVYQGPLPESMRAPQ